MGLVIFLKSLMMMVMMYSESRSYTHVVVRGIMSVEDVQCL